MIKWIAFNIFKMSAITIGRNIYINPHKNNNRNLLLIHESVHANQFSFYFIPAYLIGNFFLPVYILLFFFLPFPFCLIPILLSFTGLPFGSMRGYYEFEADKVVYKFLYDVYDKEYVCNFVKNGKYTDYKYLFPYGFITRKKLLLNYLEELWFF